MGALVIAAGEVHREALQATHGRASGTLAPEFRKPALAFSEADENRLLGLVVNEVEPLRRGAEGEIRAIILQQLHEGSAGVVQPRIEVLEVASELLRVLGVEVPGRHEGPGRVFGFQEHAPRGGFGRNEDLHISKTAGGIQPALAVAAAGRLNDRVEAGERSEYDGEIDIDPGLNDLRADDTKRLLCGQVLLDASDDPRPVLSAHERREMERSFRHATE